MKLTSENVTEIFMNCLFNEDENKSDPEIVEGIQTSFGFHKGRVAEHTKEISEMLAQLPLEFQEESGGGMSFLNACNDSDGEQWTGMHNIMDQLFVLGQACGKVKPLMPREMWKVLPGGMPYYMVLS